MFNDLCTCWTCAPRPAMPIMKCANCNKEVKTHLHTIIENQLDVITARNNKVSELTAELKQQKFNNEHNLSIDQQVADEWQRLKNLIGEARSIIRGAKPDYVYQESCNIWRSEQQDYLEKTENI